MSSAESSFRYEDLFDIENRPGAGVRLWGKAVEDQIERVALPATTTGKITLRTVCTSRRRSA